MFGMCTVGNLSVYRGLCLELSRSMDIYNVKEVLENLYDCDMTVWIHVNERYSNVNFARMSLVYTDEILRLMEHSEISESSYDVEKKLFSYAVQYGGGAGGAGDVDERFRALLQSMYLCECLKRFVWAQGRIVDVAICTLRNSCKTGYVIDVGDVDFAVFFRGSTLVDALVKLREDGAFSQGD